MDFYSKEFYDDMVPETNEDCLYLNIWTPAAAKPGDRLPVTVLDSWRRISAWLRQ